jgi:Flp pilus assembly protein TadG
MLRQIRMMLADKRGHAALMFAATLGPLLVAISMAIDYSQAVSTRADLQRLADAVAIASVQVLDQSEADARREGELVYDAGLAELSIGLIDPKLELGFVTTPKLKSNVTITATMKSVTGIKMSLTAKTNDIAVHATAEKEVGTLEIAVAADSTASMSGANIRSLRNGLTAFINTVMPDNLTPGKVRVAIVPFSRTVRLNGTIANQDWFLDRNLGTWSKRWCAGPRDGDYDMTDQTPYELPLTPLPDIANACPGQVLQPLTSDKASLLSIASNVQATGWGTANHIAASWVFRSLSPKWNTIWPTSNAPSIMSSARKIAVLMTDGINEFYTLERDVVGDAALPVACKNMRDAGIEIFVITLRLAKQDQGIYRDCASAPDQYVNADSALEMEAVFADIANRLKPTEVRLAY